MCAPTNRQEPYNQGFQDFVNGLQTNQPRWAEWKQRDVRAAGRRTSDNRNSYAPPVSGAKFGSARMGAMLGRPINAVELVFSFFAWFFLFFWFPGFTIFYSGFSILFSFFSLFFFLTILNIFKI
jgi:hypothetical protein